MSELILFRNEDRSVILIDGPKSIEDAQFLNPAEASQRGRRRRLTSSKPPEQPFKTPEPKHSPANPSAGAALAELSAAAAVEDALRMLDNLYTGPWCLPRIHAIQETNVEGHERDKKRKAEEVDTPEDALSDPVIAEESVSLQGTIASERSRFLKEAPMFELVVMDPPWPNRSVRRKRGSYALVLPFASPVSANDVAVVSSAKSGARVEEPHYGDLPRSAKHTLEAASLRQPSNGVGAGRPQTRVQCPTRTWQVPSV